MAQQTKVIHQDDIDGTKAAETVSFGLDGSLYEIDLSAKHAKHLRKSLAGFVEAARTVKPPNAAARTGRGKAAGTSASNRGRQDLTAIRAWAQDNGIAVAARGRLSEGVKEQYATATASQAS